MSATLLVLAAGFGTRFKGGIKQLTPVGKNGELLMEFSVFDAAEAGFDKVVFIIRKDIEELFKEHIGNKISDHIRVEYCFQDINDLPGGFTAPEGRTKPWGTVQAVLAARKLINEPFLIINADDYYGKAAYRDIYRYLTENTDEKKQCMAGFIIKNTISSTGAVTRGVCVSEQGQLASVTETYSVSLRDGIITGLQNGNEVVVDPESVVSMNMWGCTPEMLPEFEKCFEGFLKKVTDEGEADKKEYALPTAIDELIKSGDISVAVLPTADRWYGMTYAEDIEEVKNAFAVMTDNGQYPQPLFG